MTSTQDLAGMGDSELLANAEELERAARVAECGKILVAQAWAAANPGRELLPGGGRERAVQLGAVGTPTVAEFAPATLAARLRMSSYAGARLMADAIDIRHRLPNIQGLVETGEADARYARLVAQQTRELSPEEAAAVDEAVVSVVDGSISWHRFELVVAGAVVAAAPALARRREQDARASAFRRIRAQEGHGMAALLVRGDVAAINQIEASVLARAERLAVPKHPAQEGPAETLDERRIRALLELVTATPTDPDVRAAMPTVQLHVHTYTDPDGRVADVARVDGHGPVTLDWLTAVLGTRCHFTVRPVLDVEGQAPVDAYEIPDRHRRAVRMITPADTFPYANCLTDDMDVDHTEPWRDDGPPGQSRIGNYGPMTRHHHRIKTHGEWQVRQPFPGIYIWRDPDGVYYLVDHTGTQPLRAAS